MDKVQRDYLKKRLGGLSQYTRSLYGSPLNRPPQIRAAERMIQRYDTRLTKKLQRINARIKKDYGKVTESIHADDYDVALKAVRQFESHPLIEVEDS